MILVDTSVWINHLRSNDAQLYELLLADRVLSHPFVVGEIAVGSLRDRAEILSMLNGLPLAFVASDTEVLTFIEQHRLMGSGIGYIDAHLLAAVALTPGSRLLSHDARLASVTERLRLDLPAAR